MRIDFYHLTATPIERALPAICEKLLSTGERLLVVGAEEVIDRLDRQLWENAPDSFLPHGKQGGGAEERQPVLLSTEAEPANGARNVALADGVWREAALGFDRTFYFFDGSSIDTARGSWRTLQERGGAELHYWKQGGGGRWMEGP